MIEYKIRGFSKFETSKGEHDNFIKKIKGERYITLKNTAKRQIVLEIEDKDSKKIKNTIVFVFYILNKEIYFKMSKLDFKKETTKKEIINEKNKIVDDIEKKVEDLKYNISSDELLDFTKSKYW